ncbi:hypothetical protein [Synechococcus sp. OH30]
MKEPAGAFRDSLLLGCFVWAVPSSALDANWSQWTGLGGSRRWD